MTHDGLVVIQTAATLPGSGQVPTNSMIQCAGRRGGGLASVPGTRAFISGSGLVPAEYSSGGRARYGHTTKGGSEAARTALTGAGSAA
jgi:transposase